MRFLIAILLIHATVLAQNITNEEIWQDYKYTPQRVFGFNSMKDGKHYTVLGRNGIDQYDYATQQKVKTIKSGQFSDYQFNSDDSWILLETNSKPIYRRSKKGNYILYNVENQKEYPIHKKEIQEPTISPDGKKVAYVHQNDIYIQFLEEQKEIRVTHDGKKNHIINGITDWVYEEEFAFVRAFDWNGNSDKIAYIRFDESEVSEISIDIFGDDLYPKDLTFKYPKAGEKNADVSVHVYDLNRKKTQNISLESYTDYYIPKLQFNQVGEKDVNDLFLFVSNRHQNQLDVWKIDTENGKQNKLFTEKDDAYIQTDHLDFILLGKNKKTKGFLWSSERDGNLHIYEYDYSGNLKKQLTKGNWEVTKLYGYNQSTNEIYFQSNHTGSINRVIQSQKLSSSKPKILTPSVGVSDADFSSNFQYFINNYSTINTPPKYELRKGEDGKVLTTILDNSVLQTIQKEENVTQVEFSELNISGEKLNAWMIKPENFNTNKKYPLFMYQYSGPGSQEVLNEWNAYNYWWFQSLAQQGYIIACVDGRGTGGKGRDFKKMTYKELGKYEIEDQIKAAKYFGSLDYIDSNRVGIFGWSFGGYMVSLALTKGADVFKMGIAVAPVTNWRYYDTIYTERFMRTPEENPIGYDENSPINHVKKMKGSYLLIHGSGDDNVHVQNTMQMVESLVQANKEFDLFIYPDKNHGIYGGNTRLHLYNKMTTFIQENL